VFGLALALRLGVLLEFRTSDFSGFAGLDAEEYLDMARRLLDGSWPGPYVFQRPPLYPAFLGLLIATVGDRILVLQSIHALLGAWTAALVCPIGRRLFGSRGIGMLAGLIAAAGGTSIYLDLQLLPTALEGLLLTAMVLALARAAGSGSATWWLAGGGLLAASVLNRGTSLLLVPLLLFWVLAVTLRGWPVGVAPGRHVGRSGAWRAVALVVGPSVVAVAATAFHNARHDVLPTPDASIETHTVGAALTRLATGRFLPIASNSGLNFYLGNHPEARPLNDPNHPEHFRLYDDADRDALRQAGYSAVARDRYLVRRTLGALVEEPVRTARVFGEKILRAVNGIEIARNSNLYGHRADSWILSATLWNRGLAFPSGVVVPLALLGMGLARDRWRSWALPALVLLATVASMTIFFATARYRAPVLPLLAVFAAFAILRTVERFRAGDRRAAGIALLALGAIVVLCRLPVSPYHPDVGPYERLNLGFDLIRRGQPTRGIESFERAVEEAPRWARGLAALARGRTSQGRLDEALDLYQRALGEAPGDPAIEVDLAITLAEAGRLDEAERRFDEAIRSHPRDAEARVNRATLYWQQGRFAEALRDLERALEDDPRSVFAYETLGSALEASGDIAGARSVYDRWLRAYPGDNAAQSRLDRLGAGARPAPR
jgi:Tfp pilus assembly protein PilF